MLLSTASGQTEPMETWFKQVTGMMGLENCGICKLVGDECKNEEKLLELKTWAATIK